MSKHVTSTCVTRIAKDLANLQQSADLSLAATPRSDADIRNFRTLVIGPPDTPYEHGFFEFNFTFPQQYPMNSPKVVCITTNRGRTRFNPNIYASGKVCLSTLGTWEGLPGENWSCCQSLETVLISIQSLMSANPYENEPGFESTPADDPFAIDYARKIQHDTIRISVINRLERMLAIADPDRADSLCSNPTAAENGGLSGEDDPQDNQDDDQVTQTLNKDGGTTAVVWSPFDDLIKRRFLWYYDRYLQLVEQASLEQKDGVQFRPTLFEDGSNQMTGTYQYARLKTRLSDILAALREETEQWITSGALQTRVDSSMSRGLASHFAQNKQRLSHSVNGRSSVELELPDESNPFHWRLTIFGEVMTNLDGGIFEVQFVIPADFPTLWPRARLLTAIHHRNVSSNGTICYLPKKPDNLASHLDAIIVAVDDKQPKYDPRMVVNPIASAQFWSEGERKVYNKQLRRSANDSMTETGS